MKTHLSVMLAILVGLALALPGGAAAQGPAGAALDLSPNVEYSGQAVESRIKLGYTMPLYSKAHGMAIVASLPEEERRDLFSSGKLAQDKEMAAPDYARLTAKLDECRDKGYAAYVLPDQPSDLIKLLASAVMGPDGRPVGSLAIIGLIANSEVQGYGGLLAESSRRLSALLQRGSEAFQDRRERDTGG